jgi:hypothetical protein
MPLRLSKPVTLKRLATALAIGLIAAFVASRWCSASLTLDRNSAGLSQGCMYFNHTKGIIEPDRASFDIRVNRPFGWAWWGVATDNWHYRCASIPLWIPAIPALVIAGAFWRPGLLAVLRRRAGQCPTCGYDRQGLGPAPCPECGTTPSTAKTA